MNVDSMWNNREDVDRYSAVEFYDCKIHNLYTV
jgi:hypothetical protein